MQHCQRQQRKLHLCRDGYHTCSGDGNQQKETEEGLNSLGICPGELDAIFVTHEHIDHISGLGVFSANTTFPYMRL